MQTTSQTWKDLWASGVARLETVATIAGVEYTAITSPVINRALMQIGCSIGNAVSATCEISVRTEDAIPKSAEVQIKMRLTDGTTASEWLPAGTYYVSHRKRDPVTGIISLTCYDALLKSNAIMPVPVMEPWITSNGDEMLDAPDGDVIYFKTLLPGQSYDVSQTMAQVVADIAQFLGMEVDARTQINTGAAYVITKIDVGATINDVLRQVAAAHGANWIMTPANKLRLVPVVSAADAAAAQSDVADVAGIIGAIDIRGADTITGIRYKDDETTVVVGDETGIVIDADVQGTIALDLYDAMHGMTYQAFSVGGAIYDPAAELGDYVRAGANGEIASVLNSEAVTLGLAPRGNISTPEPDEMSDEYPYIGTSAKTLTIAKLYADSAAQEATDTLSDSLDQEGIFNRLTDDGAAQGLYIVNGQLYVNLSYARAGTLILGGTNNTDGVLQVQAADGTILVSADNGGLYAYKGKIGNFDIENGKLQYGSLAVGGEGVSVGIDGVIYNMLLDTGNTSKVRIFAQGVEWSWNGDVRSMLFQTSSGIVLRSYDSTGAYDHPIQTYNIANVTKDVYLRYDVRATERLFVTKDARLYASAVIDQDLTVSGTKSRRVTTDQYSDRLLYCYETPSPMFGDVGEGVIAEDGLCYITIDAVFAQTITTTQYQVFLQKYGDGNLWVRERKGGYFIVQGTPGLAFGWEIKAKQRDFDQRRLDSAAEPYTPETTDYGALASQHIDQINRERGIAS